jgi:hypothetical protein
MARMSMESARDSARPAAARHIHPDLEQERAPGFLDLAHEEREAAVGASIM